jgi:membrane protease YdiL (CAAX protease family)
VLLSVISYAARFSPGGERDPDVFFRWSTAVLTVVLDGLLLLLVVLIARGLPPREVFALRAPSSWREAGRVALVVLGATWLTSLVLGLAFSSEIREQAVPAYYDPARLDAFAANVFAIAIFVPVVEEATCRGLGFWVLRPRGEKAAIAGSAIAFALAHGAVFDLPWVLVTGLGLGYLRARTGSLFPCVLLHMAVNGVAMVASAALAAPL